jgi:hypothetical protein
MSAGYLKAKILGAQGNQLVPVSKSTLTVGRASHCDIVFDHPSVMAEHVRAWLDGGRIWVQDLGGASGTSLNGTRLPGLKPMLVRELDVLTLGDCPWTLSLEGSLVRAPTVNTRVPDVVGATVTDIRPLANEDSTGHKSREEIEGMRREIADLKLRLQTGKGGDGSSEASRQLSLAREELRKLNDLCRKLTDTIARLEHEKQLCRQDLEQEIADLKLKALRELKEQRENELRKFEIWKGEAVLALNESVRRLTQFKAKSWTTRPPSREMIFEWEADLNQILRRVILGNQVEQPPEIPVKTTRTLRVASKPAKDALIRYILTGLGSSCLAVLIYLSFPHFRKLLSGRGTARPPTVQRTEQASVRPSRGLVTGSPAPAVPAVYKSRQSEGYRQSYAENMLFTLKFEDAELNVDFRRKWIAELTRAAASWKVDGQTVSAFLGREMQLILDLRRLKEKVKSETAEREILARMRQRENLFLKEIEDILKNKQNVDKFLKYKRSFFTRNSRYLVRQSRETATLRR